MATSSPAQSAKAAATARAAGTYALGPAPLVALTQDKQLFATLRSVSEAAHPVRVAGSEIDFAAALMEQHAAVAVLDTAAVATPIEQLTARLHTQFPDLVLIVAGTADEQGALAAQITEGSVHRFLHKPVSEQRVRLFVEAAWRRHETGGRGAAAAAPPPPKRLPVGLIAAVLVALAAGGAWLALHSGAGDAGRAAGSSGAAQGKDAGLEALLARADQALAAGALTGPANPNAADLYREALQRNARDPRALAGLEQVIDHLVTDAEAQLADHHLDAAQQLADAGRAINPNHPRVAFLTAQINAQRQRLAQGKTQRAPTAADADAASQQALAELITNARAALADGALLEPADASVRAYLEAAQALVPNDPAVQQLRQDLLMRLEAESRTAAAAGNTEQAAKFASAAADAGADAADVAALQAAAHQAQTAPPQPPAAAPATRAAPAADSTAHSEAQFKERMAQGRLTEPAGDSARYYLEQLAQADPAGATTLAARTAFETRLLDEAHAAVQAGDFAAAQRWLTEAQKVGASPTEISAAAAELAAAQAAATPQSAAAPTTAAKPTDAGTSTAGVSAATAIATTPGAAGSPVVSPAAANSPAANSPAASAPAASPPAPAASAPPAAGAADGAAKDYVDASTLTRNRYVAPQFPLSARDRGIEGWVDMQFQVNTDGTLSEVKVLAAQPSGVFEQSALEAVRQWRYVPVMRDGQVIPQRARLRLRFAVKP